MGRKVQKLDSLINILYVLISLFMLGLGIYSLIRGSFAYVYLIMAAGALYFLIHAVETWIRGGEGAKKKGFFSLLGSLLVAALGVACYFCL